ncbi:hypothetical protein [Zavarzinia sp. CC-PAN008]|uniref:hypothetical protein n=1 Tax=Zavarzinia sp. CC-PAN008 TaxID=3243332 RepID=UPI003F749A37
MASLVSIANEALILLGQETVQHLVQDERAGRLFLGVWESVRLAVLQSHPWKAAKARKQLPALATAPAFGWARAFQLPRDCVQPRQIGDWPADDAQFSDRWTQEGRTILSNAAAPLALVYTRDVTDPDQMDALLRRALAVKAAERLALALTGTAEMQQAMGLLYQAELPQARHASASASSPAEVDGRSSWLEARS